MGPGQQRGTAPWLRGRSCRLWRMHLLMACCYWGYAGTERAFIDCVRALAAHGHRVTALVHPSAPFLHELSLPGTHVVRLDYERLLHELDTPLFVGLIEEHRPDAVVAHTPLDMWQLKAAARGRVPYVAVCHQYNVKHAVGAELAIGVNEVIVSRLQAAGQPPERTLKVPNMVHVPAGHRPSPRPWREPPVIGALGRLSPEKGLDVLVEALRLLRADGVAFRARLGGDGEQREWLASFLRAHALDEQVELCGWIHDSRRFYESIDVFCLPSRWESFGIVLLEAALWALPMVVTDTEGAREVFQQEPVARTVTPEEPRALADGLRWVLENRAAAEALATRACELLPARYGMARVGGLWHQSLLRTVEDWSRARAGGAVRGLPRCR